MTKRTTIDRTLLNELCRLGAEMVYRQLLSEYPDLAALKTSRSTAVPKILAGKTTRTRRVSSPAARKAMSRGTRRYWRRRKRAEQAETRQTRKLYQAAK